MQQKNLTVIVIVIVMVAAFAVLAWTNPSQNPPSGADVMTALDGKVGIGTTNPQDKYEPCQYPSLD